MALLKNPFFWIAMVGIVLLFVIMYKLQVFDGIIGWFENAFDIGGTGTEGAGTGTGGEVTGDTTQTE